MKLTVILDVTACGLVERHNAFPTVKFFSLHFLLKIFSHILSLVSHLNLQLTLILHFCLSFTNGREVPFQHHLIGLRQLFAIDVLSLSYYPFTSKKMKGWKSHNANLMASPHIAEGNFNAHTLVNKIIWKYLNSCIFYSEVISRLCLIKVQNAVNVPLPHYHYHKKYNDYFNWLVWKH